MAQPTSRLIFHWPVAGSPEKIPILLELIARADQPILSANELDQMALDYSGAESRFSEARVLAEHALGLINVTKQGVSITPKAEVLLKKREAVQLDLLHYLFYSAWQAEQPTNQGKAWFYHNLCECLWVLQNQVLHHDNRLSLTQQLTNQALNDFENVPGALPEKFSVGIQTINGALEWLRQLRPAVLVGETFQRRSTCSAELFLLALSRSYRLSGSVVGVDLLLSPQRRDEICKVCLLEPLQFDRMLDWIIPIFPQFLAQGTRAGSYGRFVHLVQSVNVEDLI